MDISPTALLTNFLPAVPYIVLTSVLAILGRTANSTHQDAMTQIIVAAARPILRTPAQIGRSQKVWNAIGRWSAWLLDLAVSLGLGWIVGMNGIVVKQKVIRIEMKHSSGSTVLEQDEAMNKGKILSVQDAILYAFDVLQDQRYGEMMCPLSTVEDVEVEWTSNRVKGRAEKPVSEEANLREKASQFSTSTFGRSNSPKPVILYFHGGAHCLMDPTTHRWTTTMLSKLSSADICSVRFRLSPQHPFPAALTDAFIAYLSLLSPQSESSSTSPSDRPIDPSQIILAGDSSGGNIASALLLLIITLSRNNIIIINPFNTTSDNIEIPPKPCGGLALTSPWLDTTRALPSTTANAKWDIIAPPPLDSASPPFPPDEVWPTQPPRAETYCIADICTHPLVSPLAAKLEQWKGAPPVWVCSGWEGFTDEIEVFARRIYMSSDTSVVHFEGWEGMPHCFGMMPWNQAGREALHSWAEFCGNVGRGQGEVRREFGVWRGRDGRREVKMDELGCETQGCGYTRQEKLTDDVVDRLMEQGRQWRIGLEMEMVKAWKDRSR